MQLKKNPVFFLINSLKLRSGGEGVYRNTSESQACHFLLPGGGIIRPFCFSCGYVVT